MLQKARQRKIPNTDNTLLQASIVAICEFNVITPFEPKFTTFRQDSRLTLLYRLIKLQM